MHIEPRNTAPVERVYLHTNEGPQGENAAQDLANYLHQIDGGYHVIVDDKLTVRCAGDNQVVWAEGGDNQHCLSVCLIGYSATTDWTSAYSKAMIERAAQQVAGWCKAYMIPAVHVAAGAPGAAPTQRGIAEHADDHSPASEGHTDPGSRFPIAAFCARVQDILTPPINWQKIAQLAAWEQRITAVPLRLGNQGADVSTLNQLLTLRGYGNCLGIKYGVRTAAAIAALKKAHGITSPATVFGGPAALALLSK